MNNILLVSLISFFNYQIYGGAHSVLSPSQLDWLGASQDTDIETIEDLIGTIDVNLQDENGTTALMFAVMNGDGEMVKLLLEVPEIDINKQDSDGNTALFFADENMVKLLLQHSKIDVNLQNSEGDTALIQAAENGYEDIAELLLAAPNINVNLKDNSGSNALQLATFFGESFIVKLLLQASDLEVNAQDAYGTALICAVCNEHEDIVKMFLELPSIDINAQDRAGYTAYRRALELKNQFFSLLIKNKLDQLKDKAINAIMQHDLEALKSVIKQIDIDAVIVDKAFQVNCPEIIEYLLQNSKDPRQLLARFPFEYLNPTSHLFRYFMDLAYIETSKKRVLTEAQNRCAQCKSDNCELRCSGCKLVYYCSKKCQNAHWKFHKNMCFKPKFKLVTH